MNNTINLWCYLENRFISVKTCIPFVSIEVPEDNEGLSDAGNLPQKVTEDVAMGLCANGGSDSNTAYLELLESTYVHPVNAHTPVHYV